MSLMTLTIVLVTSDVKINEKRERTLPSAETQEQLVETGRNE